MRADGHRMLKAQRPEPPPFQGGQGRSAAAVRESAALGAVALLAAVELLVIMWVCLSIGGCA